VTVQDYIGQELEIFAHALRWKAYYASLLKPYIGPRVVEVGAGMGATTPFLCDGSQEAWICLEPAPNLERSLAEQVAEGKLPACCQARPGTVADLGPERFDTLIYIDVLEHIQDDAAELQLAAEHLEPSGRLIVLSPAHQSLYSPFDQAIGHYRRYDREMLSALTPGNCCLERCLYLDSAGLLLSLGNRVLLRQSMPTLKQILFWDRWVIPTSKILDRLFGFRFGKSILAIWKQM
jgi:hypothetical protein